MEGSSGGNCLVCCSVLQGQEDGVRRRIITYKPAHSAETLQERFEDITEVIIRNHTAASVNA